MPSAARDRRSAWRPERLRALLGSCRLGRSLSVHQRVGSTNDVARRLGRDGADDGTLVLAEEQTAGRGRRGRAWESRSGAGIYASLVLRPPGGVDEDYATALQLAAGIAVAEALSPALPEPAELLWPNDCYCRGQKIAGVLVEAETTGPAVEFLVCGIGVNVNQEEREFGDDLRRQAGSVRSLAGAAVEREPLLARLLFGLEAWDTVARGGELPALCRRWEELSSSVHGARVEVEVTEGTLTGEAVGLSDRGGLLVRSGGQEREVRFGELVRVRRRR